MHRRSSKAGRAGIAAALVAGTLFAAAATAQEEKRVEKIEVHAAHDKGAHHRVVIHKDGERIELEGDHGLHMMMGGPFAHHGGGFLGVQLTGLTDELRSHFGVPGEGVGVMVSRVVDESPAARAGIEAGDVITRANGEDVTSPRSLGQVVHKLEEGAELLLEVWRDGRVETVTAAVEVRESGRGHRRIAIRCKNGESDCDLDHALLRDLDFDCGGASPCQVTVRCEDGADCTCEVNGEPTECSEIPGVPGK